MPPVYTALPKQIGRLEFLETLLVDRNRLELLHEAVMGLIQLRTLSLQFNQVCFQCLATGSWLNVFLRARFSALSVAH
jgi:hypothetical protein